MVVTADDGCGTGICQPNLSGKSWANPDVRRAAMTSTFRQALEQRSNDSEPLVIFCEEPLALQNGKTTRLLSIAAGALWQVAHDMAFHFGMEVAWFWVDVAMWKRVIVGNGNASKDDIKAFAMSVDSSTEGAFAEEADFFDAWCLARYGRLVGLMGGPPLTIKQEMSLSTEERDEYQARLAAARLML